MKKIKNNKEQETEKLFRGVSVYIPEKEDIVVLLQENKPLRIKYGIDPTTPDLHLGYLVIFRKLRLLKQLGHQIVILFGGFTARFGDPTDKAETRTLRDKKSVQKAMENYQAQLEKFFGGKQNNELAVEFRDNSEWYDKMSAEDLLRLMSETTVAQMLERDMFRDRMSTQKPIGLHEPVYPLLQGYDSVMLESDMTVVGTDQTFNENAARPLQERAAQRPQAVLGCEMIPGTDGGEKMSQSLGNAILMSEKAEEQFGKLMSLSDEAAIPYAKMLTDLDLVEITQALEKEGVQARDAKLHIAEAVVGEIQGEEAAQKAKEKFLRQFQSKEAPKNLEDIEIDQSVTGIAALLVVSGATTSTSAAKRAIEQKGVRINGKVVTDPHADIPTEKEFILEKGKRWRKKIRRT